ncbi:hypothetical protein [Lutibacter oricola]|nr:hypothetical protein [Lutibacter oricola]
MKIKLLVFISIIAFSFSGWSQNKVLDEAAEKTCEYMQSDEIKNLSAKEKTQKLGIFMIKFYSENEKKFKKSGIVLDLEKGEAGGREFGKKLGLSMVKFCPDVLMALAGDKKEKTKNEKKNNTSVVEGQIVKLEGKEFATLVIRDFDDKIQKFVWLKNFKGSDKLIQSEIIEFINVRVRYQNIECYSPLLKDYIIRKEIVEIEYI